MTEKESNPASWRIYCIRYLSAISFGASSSQPDPRIGHFDIWGRDGASAPSMGGQFLIKGYHVTGQNGWMGYGCKRACPLPHRRLGITTYHLMLPGPEAACCIARDGPWRYSAKNVARWGSHWAEGNRRYYYRNDG